MIITKYTTYKTNLLHPSTLQGTPCPPPFCLNCVCVCYSCMLATKLNTSTHISKQWKIWIFIAMCNLYPSHFQKIELWFLWQDYWNLFRTLPSSPHQLPLKHIFPTLGIAYIYCFYLLCVAKYHYMYVYVCKVVSFSDCFLCTIYVLKYEYELWVCIQ